MVRGLVGLVVCLGLVLCGSCKREPAAPSFSAAAQARLTVELLPTLTPGRFDVQVLEEDRVVAAVPRGWASTLAPGTWDPPKEAGLGFGTRFMVSTNCAGACEPKAWAELCEQAEVARFTVPGSTLHERVELTDPPGVLAIGEVGKRRQILVVRYEPGGSRYLVCRAELAPEAEAWAADFRAACLGAVAEF